MGTVVVTTRTPGPLRRGVNQRPDSCNPNRRSDRMKSFTLLVALGLGLANAQTDGQIQSASNDIWTSDANRFSDSNCQYNPYGSTLFTYVNEAAFTGTYQNLISLLDNYNPYTGTAEPPCSQCDTEQNQFLDAIMQTQPIQKLETYLQSWGRLTGSVRDLLDDIWFTPYTRSSGPLDSSGFEHVFVGEIKNGGVSGFHNWVQSYFEEQNGDFVYGNNQDVCEVDIPKFSMTWLGYSKSVTSMWIRTSPEVEMAMYTLCWVTRPNSLCTISMSGYTLRLQTYTNTCSAPGDCVGSAYPSC